MKSRSPLLFVFHTVLLFCVPSSRKTQEGERLIGRRIETNFPFLIPTYSACAAKADPSLFFQPKTSLPQWKQRTWTDMILKFNNGHLVGIVIVRKVVESGVCQLFRSHLQVSWPGLEAGKTCILFFKLGENSC